MTVLSAVVLDGDKIVENWRDTPRRKDMTDLEELRYDVVGMEFWPGSLSDCPVGVLAHVDLGFAAFDSWDACWYDPEKKIVEAWVGTRVARFEIG